MTTIDRWNLIPKKKKFPDRGCGGIVVRTPAGILRSTTWIFICTVGPIGTPVSIDLQITAGYPVGHMLFEDKICATNASLFRTGTSTGQ